MPTRSDSEALRLCRQIFIQLMKCHAMNLALIGPKRKEDF